MRLFLLVQLRESTDNVHIYSDHWVANLPAKGGLLITACLEHANESLTIIITQVLLDMTVLISHATKQ